MLRPMLRIKSDVVLKLTLSFVITPLLPDGEGGKITTAVLHTYTGSTLQLYHIYTYIHNCPVLIHTYTTNCSHYLHTQPSLIHAQLLQTYILMNTTHEYAMSLHIPYSILTQRPPIPGLVAADIYQYIASTGICQ
jgi:hypothetical protein